MSKNVHVYDRVREHVQVPLHLSLSFQQEVRVLAPSCEEQGGFRFLDNLQVKDLQLGHTSGSLHLYNASKRQQLLMMKQLPLTYSCH